MAAHTEKSDVDKIIIIEKKKKRIPKEWSKKREKERKKDELMGLGSRRPCQWLIDRNLVIFMSRGLEWIWHAKKVRCAVRGDI